MRICSVLQLDHNRKGNWMKPTGRTLRHGHLFYPCIIPARCYFHLAMIRVNLSIWSTYRLPIIATVSWTHALLKILILQAAKNVIAWSRMNKAWKVNTNIQSNILHRIGKGKMEWQFSSISVIQVFILNSLRLLIGVYKLGSIRSFGNKDVFLKEPYCSKFQI